MEFSEQNNSFRYAACQFLTLFNINAFPFILQYIFIKNIFPDSFRFITLSNQNITYNEFLESTFFC